MGEPVTLDDTDYAKAIDTAVAVVEAVRSDWTPPQLATHDVFLMARVVDTLHEHRTALLDACAIVKAAVDTFEERRQLPERLAAAWAALDELVRPGRALTPVLKSVP